MLQSIDKKKIFFYIILILLLSTLSNLSLIESNKKILKITNIEISGLNENLSSEIKKSINFILNENLLFLGKKEINNELNKFNYLESYDVLKVFPSKLKINLKKTEIIGISIADNKKYYLGSNGRLILFEKFQNNKHVPYIFGKFKPNDFIQLKKMIEKNNIEYNKIKEFFYFSSGRWDIVLKDNTKIRLPKQNVNNSIFNAVKIIENKKIINKKIIDLRIPNQVILSNE